MFNNKNIKNNCEMLILNYNNMLLRYDFMCNENIITEVFDNPTMGLK